jgi:hypothetical protein
MACDSSGSDCAAIVAGVVFNSSVNLCQEEVFDMNKWYSLLALVSVLSLAACSGPDPKPEVVANGGAGEADKINDLPVSPQLQIPRVQQAQVIGVVRELVNSGCVVKTVGTIDGVHFSQLKITCGDPQAIPSVD